MTAGMQNKSSVPRHVAIIMDGNGRWAQQRRKPRTAGHRAGIERVREILSAAIASGVEVLTLYAFSSENWSRPAAEVNTLMQFFAMYLKKEVPRLNRNNIRFLVIGRQDKLPAAVVRSIELAQEQTRENDGLTFVLAINYGSRQEIVDAARKVARDIGAGVLDAQALDPETFSGYLYTAGLPDPDLLIRTSGEQRISNFLLWQISYSELYFPQVLWPDFSKAEFAAALAEYARRTRRFGGITTKK
jgi:undecaprenyl diphosphate synthase